MDTIKNGSVFIWIFAKNTKKRSSIVKATTILTIVGGQQLAS
jgi:hypothetical protein